MSTTLPQDILDAIALELNIPWSQVNQTLRLLLDGCTVPFIARYRKEVTGSLDEVQIRDIRDAYDHICFLNERKTTILNSISEQGKLTDDLKAKILACSRKTELEDLYLPYKPKKRTRGQIAAEKGLGPVGERLLVEQDQIADISAFWAQFVGSHEDLTTEQAVSAGVNDYLAERISEMADVRQQVRQWILQNAVFSSQVRDEFREKKTKYNNYYDFSEPVNTIAAHRLMALRRGEKEEVLRLTLSFDESIPLQFIADAVIQHRATDSVRAFLLACIKDSYSRLIAPSLETEIRLETKDSAETEAMAVFSKNLRHLLLLSPIPKRVVMGIDPGLRTGSKIAVVDKTGQLLDYLTIFPIHDQGLDHPKNKAAAEALLKLVHKHGVSFLSIGNGTAGREMEQFVDNILKQNPELTVRVVVVNEAGASVYSASDVAREEFPDLDITYRGAVSIGRRLQDPLAELVKIDPKSIGVGQYQHDVNQGKLKKQLGDVVESCVNYVGVRLNTASPSLLSYVAGIGEGLAKSIVRHRDANGEFKSRQNLMEIPGFGPKTFEQAAGFLRIPESDNPLDNTAVHPESYGIIQRMAESLSIDVKDLVGNKELLSKIQLETFVNESVGLPTLQDVLKELFKPGRDPREEGSKHSYTKEIRSFEQLQEGQVLTGTVTNVTNFGAFVDIGVHQDGLIHVSELSHQFVKDVSSVIRVGDCIKVKLIGLDKERKRISLSKKACEIPVQQASVQQPSGGHQPRASQGQSHQPRAPQGQNHQPRSQQAYGGQQAQQPRAQQSYQSRPQPRPQPSAQKPHEAADTSRGSASLQDLLKKFNTNRV